MVEMMKDGSLLKVLLCKVAPGCTCSTNKVQHDKLGSTGTMPRGSISIQNLLALLFSDFGPSPSSQVVTIDVTTLFL